MQSGLELLGEFLVSLCLDFLYYVIIKGILWWLLLLLLFHIDISQKRELVGHPESTGFEYHRFTPIWIKGH